MTESTGIITLEFPKTQSQSFPFVLKAAQACPGFAEIQEGSQTLYRVSFARGELREALALVEQLKGWRRRAVFVDGEQVPWESVFAFLPCYLRRSGAYDPERYCFGDEFGWQTNVWGCVQAQMPFRSRATWLSYGRWVSADGDWQFDKERIRHELRKRLHRYRFCPALDIGLAADVVDALPEVVNPKRDRDWVFLHGWGEMSGLVLRRPGPSGVPVNVTVVGVGPKGPGAVAAIARRLKRRLGGDEGCR
jgi:hypothetical protein